MTQTEPEAPARSTDETPGDRSRPSRRPAGRLAGSRRRLAVAAVAVLVTAAVGVTLGVVLLPSKAGAQGITSGERAAMQAAGNAVVDLLSYSRASFDADYDRALAGTTGKLHDDMAGAKAQTLKTMNQGGFDLAAKLDTTALVPATPGDGADGGSAKVLVVVSGWTVTDDGTASQPKIERVQMTMEDTDGHWLASDLQVPDGVFRSSSSTGERDQVVDAAASCIATMNTYDYHAMADAKQKALACTTGSFTDHYAASFDDVSAAAQKAATSQTFEVTGAGIQSLDGDDAKLLVFGQIETTAGGKTPEYAVLSAEVTLHRTDGTWKVTGYRTSP
jgi:Mce-associated membrane protein